MIFISEHIPSGSKECCQYPKKYSINRSEARIKTKNLFGKKEDNSNGSNNSSPKNIFFLRRKASHRSGRAALLCVRPPRELPRPPCPATRARERRRTGWQSGCAA